MERVEKTVFLSYRRTNVVWGLAIFQSLTRNGYDVFFDYSGLGSGDFERVIVENIKARAHFLVLLTPSALERCQDPGDWLRREIETALSNKRNIVPLMLDGFDFSAPSISSQLIGSLAPLKHYNALRIPPDYFDEAINRLQTKFLNIPIASVLHPASLFAQQVAKTEKVAATAEPVVKEKELTAQQWFERAYAATDPSEKARFYNEAIRLKPDFAEAFNNRGDVRYNNGDFVAALDDFSEAIRLKPDYAEAFNNRGDVRYNNGDFVAALNDYNKAIHLKPDFAVAFINCGLVRRSQGDLQAALNDYNEAIRLKPDEAFAFNNRGNVHRDQHDYAAALNDFNEAIRLKPDEALAFNNRGNVHRDQGDDAAALNDYNEAIRLKPDLASAFVGRGNVWYVSGDLAAALNHYNEAIRLKPDLANAFYNRSLVRRKTGDVAGADEDYNTAIRLGFKPKT